MRAFSPPRFGEPGYSYPFSLRTLWFVNDAGILLIGWLGLDVLQVDLQGGVLLWPGIFGILALGIVCLVVDREAGIIYRREYARYYRLPSPPS